MNKKQRYECQECGVIYNFSQDEWEEFKCNHNTNGECQHCGRELNSIPMNNPYTETIINLTTHPINIGDIQIESSGILCRVSEVIEYYGKFADVQLIRKAFGKIENLPKRVDGVMYVVSIIVALAANERCNWDSNGKRNDLLVPGEIIRDEQGKVIGCKNLALV